MTRVIAILLSFLLTGCALFKKTPVYDAYVHSLPTLKSPIFSTLIADVANHEPASNVNVDFSTAYGSKYSCRTDLDGLCKVNLVNDLGIREASDGSSTTVIYQFALSSARFSYKIQNNTFLSPIFTVTAAIARAHNKPSVIQSTRNVEIRRGESYSMLRQNKDTGSSYVPICMKSKGIPIAYASSQDGTIRLVYIRNNGDCEQ